MPLFLGLYLGHLMGDFVFQPGRLVVAKRRGLAGMLLHTSIVVACTALVSLGDIGPRAGAVALAGAAHLAIEYMTVKARRVADATGLVVFLLDQALHVTSLALISLALGAGSMSPILVVWDVSLAVLAAVAGVVTVAFFGAILAFEFHIASLGPEAPMTPILGFDAQRLYGMVERAGALSVAIISPAPLLGALAFAPRVLYALRCPPAVRARHTKDAAVGLVLCAVVWALLLALVMTIT
ncbi:MAG: DUF3307 domain-containing protein [Coriobacteriia bacterium]